MKHLFPLISSIILFATAGIGTVAASDTAVDGIYYNFDDATLTAKVTYRGAEDEWMYDSTGDLAYVGDLVIPASVTYNDKVYTVVGLDADALINSKKLLTLSLPATVTSIGDRAFTLCNALQSITVDTANPALLSYDGLLYYRNPFTIAVVPRGKTGALELPDGLVEIPSGKFQKSSIESVIIPNSVTTIKDGAFSECKLLVDITIGNRVHTIERSAFMNDTAIQVVQLPASVRTIGASAFLGCFHLTYLTIKEGLTTIEESAFSGCSSLCGIYLPSTLTYIGNNAFSGCISLTSIMNNSTFDLQSGSDAYGGVALYATDIFTGSLPTGAHTSTVQEPIVLATPGDIIIHYAEGRQVQVYNAAGLLVAQQRCATPHHTLSVSTDGLYIVRLDNRAYKVLVR
ncbi:MAG: leucine-rich repeat domain-containing protein [Bacteroidales bacterium]|nr:leucine-rich repeat domain-containing protein [Bacteroidales bacterium]